MVLKCFKDSVRTPYPKEKNDALIVGKEDNTNIDIYKEDERIYIENLERSARLQKSGNQ